MLDRRTYGGYKCSFRRAVIENKCEFSKEISHNLICGVRTSIPQSSVSFDNYDHFICSFVQSILLFKMRYILNVALKQAEYVVHYRKQSTRKENGEILDQFDLITM